MIDDDDNTPEAAEAEPAQEPTPPTPLPGPWQIGKLQVHLGVPGSFAVRHEIMAAAADHAVRACAAALAACWQGPDRPKASYSGHKYDVLKFGGAVIDELVGRGATMSQVLQAGTAALKLLAPTVVTEREVTERTGFSSGGGAASS